MTQTNYEFEITKIEANNWVSGWTTDRRYRFSAKIFNEGSEYGIGDGRISKLFVTDQGGDGMERWVMNYDRGWDQAPWVADRPICEALIAFLEATPKTDAK